MILLLLTATFAAQERAVCWMPYGAAPLQDMAPQNDDIFTMIIYSFLTFDQSPNYLPSGPNNYSCRASVPRALAYQKIKRLL